jgi:hypothetical protein
VPLTGDNPLPHPQTVINKPKQIAEKIFKFVIIVLKNKKRKLKKYIKIQPLDFLYNNLSDNKKQTAECYTDTGMGGRLRP